MPGPSELAKLASSGWEPRFTATHKHASKSCGLLCHSPVALSKGQTPKKISNSLHPTSSMEKPLWGPAVVPEGPSPQTLGAGQEAVR